MAGLGFRLQGLGFGETLSLRKTTHARRSRTLNIDNPVWPEVYTFFLGSCGNAGHAGSLAGTVGLEHYTVLGAPRDLVSIFRGAGGLSPNIHNQAKWDH